jgi:hypothetical protein
MVRLMLINISKAKPICDFILRFFMNYQLHHVMLSPAGESASIAVILLEAFDTISPVDPEMNSV